MSKAELCADCIRAWSEQGARGWEGSSAWVPAGPRSLPLRKLPGICVFSMQHRQDAEGWERDRFPSAVNRLGVGYGGWDLTLCLLLSSPEGSNVLGSRAKKWQELEAQEVRGCWHRGDAVSFITLVLSPPRRVSLALALLFALKFVCSVASLGPKGMLEVPRERLIKRDVAFHQVVGDS